MPFGSQTATATQMERMNDGNGNGTVAYLFCLVQQVVNHIITAMLYPANPAGMYLGSRCPGSGIRCKQTQTNVIGYRCDRGDRRNQITPQ